MGYLYHIMYTMSSTKYTKTDWPPIDVVSSIASPTFSLYVSSLGASLTFISILSAVVGLTADLWELGAVFLATGVLVFVGVLALR